MDIFMTPWVDLKPEEIKSCIKSGAKLARIHTGKANIEKILELINIYNLHNFRYYLDLRGNKPNTELIDGTKNKVKVKIGQKVCFYSNDQDLVFLPNCDHFIKINFIPEVIKIGTKGDLNVDDGAILFNINKILEIENKVVMIETVITKTTTTFVYHGDGISSTNIYIHSGTSSLLSNVDIEILKNIPDKQKLMVKNVSVSFCEEGELINEAENTIYKLGYKNIQIIPKVETISGIINLKNICKVLKQKYGDSAELQIGRGDLTTDCTRGNNKYRCDLLVDEAIKVCKQYQVKIGVLALVLQSVRRKHKLDRNSRDYEPSASELENILHLKNLNVDYVGLTNDDYIDHPEKMIESLYKNIDN